MEFNVAVLDDINRHLAMIETYSERSAWALEALARQADSSFQTKEQKRQSDESQ